MNAFSLGKYKAIVIAIGVFVGLIAGVMVLNFMISTQLASDAVGINIAGLQRMLSQRLVKDLLSLQTTAQKGEDVSVPLGQLQHTAHLFDTTLNAFRHGGHTTGSGGQEVSLSKVTTEAGRAALEEATKLWAPFKQLVDEVVAEPPDIAWLTRLDNVIDYGQHYNVDLLRLMNELAVELQETADTVSVNLAGRQRMLSQRLVKEVLELKVATVAGKDITEPFEALGVTVTLFDTTLRAFQNGGAVTAADGTLVSLPQADSPTSQEVLSASAKLWKPYKSRLHDVLSEATDAIWFEQIDKNIAYGREHNLTLLKLMNALTTELERLTTAKVTRLRYIQAAAITLALAYFFIVFFRFVRQLRQSDAMAEKARQETQNILNTVQEGLFLLDSEFKIGSQFSGATQKIFDNKKLEDTALQELLGDVVTERDLQLTEDYIALLFGDRVNENLITDINPLNQVEVNLALDDGQYETKYLSFNFNRVRIDDKLSHVLVTVNDISERVKLQQEIEEVKEKAQDQLDMLLNILHVEKQTLGAFLSDTETALKAINDIFRQPKVNAAQFRQSIDAIFRIIHKTKGEALALELASFETRAHEFEDMLTRLRESDNISGNDFLPLTVKLNEFMAHHASVASMVQRFNEMHSQNFSEPTSGEANPGNWDALDHLVQRIASEQGKQVRLCKEGLEDHGVPEPYQKPVREIAIQLLRNAVVHGIEPPDERLAAHKADAGQLEVKFTHQGTGYELTIRDDGRGIDAEKLRARALKQNLGREEEVQAWDHDRLISLIFQPGFSTASEITKDAGRGVGMDVIKETVESIQGHLEMSTVPGQYCEFKVVLPEAVSRFSFS